MAIDMAEAGKVFAIGAAIGALGYFVFSKANIQIGLPQATAQPMAPAATGMGGTPQVPMQMPATTMMASAYPAFGQDVFQNDDQWNNSEVWDTRNRKYFSDNILFNKLPYIPMSLESDFIPNERLSFSQAYGGPDHDSPRPRFGTHALDREIADEYYPRKTPLPFYF